MLPHGSRRVGVVRAERRGIFPEWNYTPSEGVCVFNVHPYTLTSESGGCLFISGVEGLRGTLVSPSLSSLVLTRWFWTLQVRVLPSGMVSYLEVWGWVVSLVS